MSELPDQGHFALFALPVRFRLDEAALGAAWRALQAQFHPDRAAHLSAVEQRRALQWATRINEAYNVLRDPLARAAHLLELNGAPVDLERNVGADAEFLAQQMQWREALEDARSDASALAALARAKSKPPPANNKTRWHAPAMTNKTTPPPPNGCGVCISPNAYAPKSRVFPRTG